MWVQTYDADMKGARRFSAELSILWEEAKCDKLEWVRNNVQNGGGFFDICCNKH